MEAPKGWLLKSLEWPSQALVTPRVAFNALAISLQWLESQGTDPPHLLLLKKWCDTSARVRRESLRQTDIIPFATGTDWPIWSYTCIYARSTANRDSMSIYIVLHSILYEQYVHVYFQLRLFLSYGQCPVPRCPDKGCVSVITERTSVIQPSYDKQELFLSILCVTL